MNSIRSVFVASSVAVLLSALTASTAGARQVPADAATLRQLSLDVNSAEPKVRRAALKALAVLGPEALDPISLLVADPVREIRRDAMLAVAAIYVEPPPRQRVASVLGTSSPSRDIVSTVHRP